MLWEEAPHSGRTTRHRVGRAQQKAALHGPLELTGQHQVQEPEGCFKSGVYDAALMGVEGKEDQAAEEGQESSSYCEATGHLVAVEDTVELRRVSPVLVAISQERRKDDQGEDLWAQRTGGT